jgi:hypothetical protein
MHADVALRVQARDATKETAPEQAPEHDTLPEGAVEDDADFDGMD